MISTTLSLPDPLAALLGLGASAPPPVTGEEVAPDFSALVAGLIPAPIDEPPAAPTPVILPAGRQETAAALPEDAEGVAEEEGADAELLSWFDPPVAADAKPAVSVAVAVAPGPPTVPVAKGGEAPQPVVAEGPATRIDVAAPPPPPSPAGPVADVPARFAAVGNRPETLIALPGRTAAPRPVAAPVIAVAPFVSVPVEIMPIAELIEHPGEMPAPAPAPAPRPAMRESVEQRTARLLAGTAPAVAPALSTSPPAPLVSAPIAVAPAVPDPELTVDGAEVAVRLPITRPVVTRTPDPATPPSVLATPAVSVAAPAEARPVEGSVAIAPTIRADQQQRGTQAAAAPVVVPPVSMAAGVSPVVAVAAPAGVVPEAIVPPSSPAPVAVVFEAGAAPGIAPASAPEASLAERPDPTPAKVRPEGTVPAAAVADPPRVAMPVVEPATAPAIGSVPAPAAPVTAAPAAAAFTAMTLPTVDTARADWIDALVERIEVVRAADGIRHAQMRLAPDALGVIDVRVEQGPRGEIAVHVEAQTAQGRAAMAEAAPRLAEMVEARGLRLAESGVDAGRSGAGGDRRQPQADPRQPERPAPARSSSSDTEASAAADRLA